MMEYASGKDLRSYLKKKKNLSEEEAYSIFMQICKATEYFHWRNIIHRDLKLENILMADRSSDRILIVDFGIMGNNHTGKGS